MKDIFLNIEDLTSPEQVQAYLREALALPDDNAESLDDIYDYLTDLSDPTRITLPQEVAYEEHMGEYGERLLTVFEEAAIENSNLEVEII
ncbi:MAG TPA: barstar family protein [Candidatus Avacidaminococcus intestinavium]|uniref:Barstar family protein n=1 Tax=Candidatus Avacidaminococcus intestinavium TaxID=2840684 RepID=A0A9D1MQP8_9FIRM|nr:barstar family protein [Candidatus Avacidaminococcus intestinavium]